MIHSAVPRRRAPRAACLRPPAIPLPIIAATVLIALVALLAG